MMNNNTLYFDISSYLGISFISGNDGWPPRGIRNRGAGAPVEPIPGPLESLCVMRTASLALPHHVMPNARTQMATRLEKSSKLLDHLTEFTSRLGEPVDQ